MHKSFWLTIISCFSVAGVAMAQNGKPHLSAGNGNIIYERYAEMSTPLTGVISLTDVTSNLDPVLARGIYHAEEEKPAGENIKLNELLPYIEDGKNASARQAVELPAIYRNYTGMSDNRYTPPDNTIAVNNDGIVVSAMNSNYRIFKKEGGLLKSSSFFDALKTQFPQFKQTYYDPRVIYDSESERFIMVVLHGHSSDSTNIMVMFSKTNNPQDGWNLYALNGDVLNKNQWTDYPNIAVSNNELYITGNLFNDNGYFEEAFILQIKKGKGYDGQNLEYQAWSNIRDNNGNRAFTLVPVSYGLQGNYGPGVYLLSNNQGNSNTTNLYEITDDMEASNEQLVRTTLSMPFSYAAPQYSSQKGSTDLLNSGDSRIKQGFFLGDYIHYVYTSRNSSNNSSIVYARVNVKTNTQDYRVLGQTGINYNYPSIASIATNADEKNVLIGFLRSSSTIYPEMRVVHCDENFEFSTSVVVQAGSSAVNILNDDVERWGDYTGMARKYSLNSVLFSGAYGYNSGWTTRIAEIGLNSIKVGEKEIVADNTDVSVFPNPARDIYSVTFNMKQPAYLNIRVLDMQGRTVEVLFSGTEKAGEKYFSFNRAGLSKGMYLLNIEAGKEILRTEKLIVE